MERRVRYATRSIRGGLRAEIEAGSLSVKLAFLFGCCSTRSIRGGRRAKVEAGTVSVMLVFLFAGLNPDHELLGTSTEIMQILQDSLVLLGNWGNGHSCFRSRAVRFVSLRLRGW